MNIVIPMAGKGTRLLNAGYDLPKPLVEICGKTIAEWAISTVGLKGNYIFICLKEHIEKLSLDKKLSNISPNCTIVSIDSNTEGTAETILQASKFIDTDDELFISDSDHCMIWDSHEFENEIKERKMDACVLTYPDKQTSNAYSYVKLNENGFVTAAAEKVPISNIAAAGMHYYKKGSDFVKYSRNMIKNNIRFNNEFYVTPVYNQLVADNKKIITYSIQKKWPLGSPEEIKNFVENFS